MARLTRTLRRLNTARLATYLIALWKLSRHRDTPWRAKAAAFFVLAYAVSPIDLIPDFIPFLGQLDDILLIPAGLALVTRLTPPELWQECLHEAGQSRQELPRLWWGAVIVVAVWLTLLGLFVWWLAATVAEGAR